MTYIPDRSWTVIYNGPPGGWREGECELSKVPRPACVVGDGKGFIYVHPGGLWTHIRCYHRTHAEVRR